MLPLIGEGVDRAEGRKKVTGTAQYAAEFALPGLCHAVLVSATIGKGRVAGIDVAAAERMPGVLAVLCHRDDPGPLHAVKPSEPGGSSQMPAADKLFTGRVLYFGQYVATVVAETLEQARHAADTLAVRYADVEQPFTDLEAGLGKAAPPESGKAKDEPAATRRGDPDAAAAAAPVKIANVYRTPHETHNPMEMHATTATWDASGKLTLYDATQGISDCRSAVAQALAIPPEQIRVISPFLGGGFGCKGSTWPHTALAAAAAKAVGRPVRLMLTRAQMFVGVGYRSPTRQAISMAADHDGTLASFTHDSVSQSPTFTTFLEAAALPTRGLYASRTAASSHKIVRVDTGAPCQMRAPGEATGLFAFEVAMDELAVELGMDPLALRMRNYAAEKDPENGKPFSSKSLDKCYRQAAERFGWAKRNPRPRSMADGKYLVGYGMATASYPANRKPAAATVIAYADGSVVVRSGTQDIGTGTYTIMAQVAAQELGLPPSAVRALLGDTILPKSGVSGGSTTAASVCTAVQLAAARLRTVLIATAIADPKSKLHGLHPDAVRLGGNGTFVADGGTDTIRGIVSRGGTNSVEAEAGPDDFKVATKSAEDYSKHAFGAVFAEVHVDPDLGMVTVPRLVGAYAIGRVLNAKTARSQLLGGLVFAQGMALLEDTATDRRTGGIPNASLAEYLVPTNADVRGVDVILVEEDDPHVNPIGVKGVGEIGIVGGPAAIANAVFHATGKRVRDLPITPDKLL